MERRARAHCRAFRVAPCLSRKPRFGWALTLDPGPHTHKPDTCEMFCRWLSISDLQVGLKNTGRIFGLGFQQVEGEKRTTHKVQDTTSPHKSPLGPIMQLCTTRREKNGQPVGSRGIQSALITPEMKHWSPRDQNESPRRSLGILAVMASANSGTRPRGAVKRFPRRNWVKLTGRGTRV